MLKRICTCLFVAAVCVTAHDLYVMPETFFPKAGKLTVALHNGDAFPESEVVMNVERLRDVRLTSRAGSVEMTGARKDGNRALLDAVVSGSGDMILSGRSIPNFIEMEPKKFIDYLKEEGLNDLIAWREKNGESGKAGRERYSKNFKSIILSGTPDDTYNRKLGLTLEIVPEANPYTLKVGQKLPVQVLFRGQPAADIQVEAAWASGANHDVKPLGRTDAAGRFSVPVDRAGKYRLHSLRMERCAEPAAADWESFWASLTFEIR